MRHKGELKSLVICGFPGIGKTTLYRKVKANDLTTTMIDLDVSDYNNNPDFPNNYIAAVLNAIDKYAVIMIDSSDVVRKALRDNNIFYCIIYPSIKSGRNYLERYNGNLFKKCPSLEDYQRMVIDIERDNYPKIKLTGSQICLSRDLIHVIIVKMSRIFQ